jgi:hypothetical protein
MSNEQLTPDHREQPPPPTIRDVVSHMGVALGFARRPLSPMEVVELLPDALRRTFAAEALANPSYESRSTEMQESYVKRLLVDTGLAQIDDNWRGPYYGGLTLTASGRKTLEEELAAKAMDPDVLPYFDEVVVGVGQIEGF